MTGYITDLSQYASSLLGSVFEYTSLSPVSSVYRKTVNFFCHGQLFALQSAGSPISPVSLITDLTAEELAALSIQKGDPVSVTGNCINILTADGSNLSFSFEASAVQDLVLSGISDHQTFQSLFFNIRQILSECQNSDLATLFFATGSVCDSIYLANDLILGAARNRIKKVILSLADKAHETAADQLMGMIGLGLGLTPSGDDFVCGVLAGLRMLHLESTEFAQALHRKLPSYLERTNEISRTFLDCALAGQFSEAVCLLPTCPEQQKIRTMFASIGHSSGFDTLAGIFFSFLIEFYFSVDEGSK